MVLEFEKRMLVKTFIGFDKYLSSKIHDLELPMILQVWFYWFGVCFNRELNIITIILASLVFPKYMEYHQPYYGLYFGPTQFSCGMINLVLTVMLKKWLRR